MNRLFVLVLLVSSTIGSAMGESFVYKGKIVSATFTALPLIQKTAEGDRQVVAVELNSDGLKEFSIQVSAKGWPEQKPISLGELPKGTKQVELSVPASVKNKSMSVLFQWAGKKQRISGVPIKYPKEWTIYLVQHTHTDIGYTKPQTEILPEHLRYIDYALDYCDLTDNYPDDSKFRWTCETSWAVREYLKRRPASQIERLKQRVKEGRIEIAGMMLNMAEIATESSMAASLQPIRTFKEQYGFPVTTAMQDDVNGIAWCMADYFSEIGIKYLTMGINKTRSLLPFDKPTPFWWESPSGKRILAYRSDHYMTANEWQIHQGKMDLFKPKVVNYLRSLEARKYPFDRVGVQFSGYLTDNSPPAKIECDLIKTWNETYAWPKLRLATIHEFPEYVEKEHGNELKVFRAAWPDWWTDGFGSAARETGASRDTHVAMQISNTLLSMASLLGTPIAPGVFDRIADIQDDLLFYDEHTYGAAESISDPMAENSQVQWGEKAAYVWDAVKKVNLLREEAFGLLQGYLPRANVPTIAVFNTLNWKRSGLVRVFIDHEILPVDRDFKIVDSENGESIPAQAMNGRAEGTYWALWVKDVPPQGYKTCRIEVNDKKRAPQATLDSTTSLENAFYSLTIDPQKGTVTSLVDKETGKELVDKNASWGLGQCIYETISGGRDFKPGAFKRTSLKNVKMQKGLNGPIWKSVLLTAEMDGCAPKNGVQVEIRLYETEKRIEFHYTVRKLPITDAEAVYVSFPFSLPDFKIFYEAQGGVVNPGENQIPGSSSDWQTVQNFIAVRNSQEQIVYVSDQAPLVQLGDINLGKWQPITKVEKPYIYSWVMNNYWFTNFRVSQEGEFKWNYCLTSTKDISNTFATRFGWGSRIPLASRVLPPGKSDESNSKSLSTLTVDAPNLLLVEAKPAVGGEGIILQFREVEGKPVTLEQGNVGFVNNFHKADEVNVLEEVINGDITSLTFRPYEVKFLHFVVSP